MRNVHKHNLNSDNISVKIRHCASLRKSFKEHYAKKQPVLLKVDTTAMDSYRRDDKDGICIKKEAGKQGKPQWSGVGSSQLVRSLLSVTSAQCVSSFYIQIVSA